MNRIIRITGIGQLKIKPDVTRINITLTGVYKDYVEAISQSSEKTGNLRELLSSFGFAGSDLKTLSFNVNTEYEGYTDKNGHYKQKFVGYRFNHQLKLELVSDNERLGRILYALAKCQMHPEIRLSYAVQDPERAKNMLLGRAIADAKEKAEVIAAAAGITLGDVQSIDYSWDQMDFEVWPMSNEKMIFAETSMMAGASYDLNIEPNDIDVSDTVTVIWGIK